MKTLATYVRLMVLILPLAIFSCSKDDDGSDPAPAQPIVPIPIPDPGDGGGNNNPPKIEGAIEGKWKTQSANDLGNFSTNVNALTFNLDSTNNYSLIYHNMDGSRTTFEGISSVKTKSQHKHTNGASIWRLTLSVMYINGSQVAGGGWKGIATFDGENTLLLNVEPTVVGWDPHPTAANGLGSGTDGNRSIAKFQRQ